MTAEPTAEPTARDSYRFWIDDRVRFADVDALGHANNNAIGIYLEQGRVGLLASMGGFRPESPWTVVIARSTVDYRAELRFGDAVQVGMRVVKVGNTSVTLAAGVFSGDTCAATQECVCVIVDAQTHRPTPIGDAMRAALAAYQ